MTPPPPPRPPYTLSAQHSSLEQCQQSIPPMGPLEMQPITFIPCSLLCTPLFLRCAVSKFALTKDAPSLPLLPHSCHHPSSYHTLRVQPLALTSLLLLCCTYWALIIPWHLSTALGVQVTFELRGTSTRSSSCRSLLYCTLLILLCILQVIL